MASTEKKLSPVEGIKDESNYLRGTLAEEFSDGTDHFSKESIQLIKHFGMYQQDDRDARAANRAKGAGKEYIMMIRARLPAGLLTGKQLMEELDLCDDIGNGTLRITSRQSTQFHGVSKDDVRQLMQRMKGVGLTTLGACGDVNRNVMCCPAPFKNNELHDQIQKTAFEIADHFAPRTGAYREIFLQDPETGEKIQVDENGNEVVEPIYGKHYLPRKFKMGICLPEDNCIDVYTQDLGMIAVHEGGKIVGYNILVGGGMGRTPSADKTYPALGLKLTYVSPEDLIGVCEAVVKVQRDFGNREDRKVARLKYTVRDMGLEEFKKKVEEYFGRDLPEPHPTDVTEFDDHKGWSEQGDGKWFYGLNVENGRIADFEDCKLKTAIREICTTLNPGIHFTGHQDIIFSGIEEGDKAKLEEILKKHGVVLTSEISNTLRWSMACVAWPTCGLSITESERALPGMVDDLEKEVAKLGLEDEKFTLRMTGCPNGCARPYNSDIGLVGRAKEKYTMFLGGRRLGNRLNYIYKDMVPADEVVPELVKVFTVFKEQRTEGETLGDFCDRLGQEKLLEATGG
ncbi:NADPH-dependent assimilatory sulfite reductase hemoprotein subunit [Bremerella sp. T1]|uniref:NADPH-dependent assimilatory sulfite reductase hemoprotein subunit n=1 Tax=Bremerella sp. TYQ1 TaxID=3119568 RepID=UPI001CCD2F2B|nr:NADPH-dependent assimilatory sulfite reductase hemoprotein subunit [Bremerella volcania]UBM37899.1 NADPH-dependent assimilatory sulfite reductase hemoprotein subunit [Bremerella volcania]